MPVDFPAAAAPIVPDRKWASYSSTIARTSPSSFLFQLHSLRLRGASSPASWPPQSSLHPFTSNRRRKHTFTLWPLTSALLCGTRTLSHLPSSPSRGGPATPGCPRPSPPRWGVRGPSVKLTGHVPKTQAVESEPVHPALGDVCAPPRELQRRACGLSGEKSRGHGREAAGGACCCQRFDARVRIPWRWGHREQPDALTVLSREGARTEGLIRASVWGASARRAGLSVLGRW